MALEHPWIFIFLVCPRTNPCIVQESREYTDKIVCVCVCVCVCMHIHLIFSGE